MNKKKIKDEYLEQLWSMKERNTSSIDELKRTVHADYNEQILRELVAENIVEADIDKNTVMLTKYGENNARQVIRAHRLAERLISDVLGGDYEDGAGEFEHTINLRLVDGICTLLGHPRECPHGRPIPEGECCQRSAKTAESSVIQLTELDVGQSAKVAYVQCKSDRQMHKLDGLQIKPGVRIKLHQKYPTFVIECESMSIALDEEIASNIKVWTKNSGFSQSRQQNSKGFFKGFGLKRKRRQRGGK